MCNLAYGIRIRHKGKHLRELHSGSCGDDTHHKGARDDCEQQQQGWRTMTKVDIAYGQLRSPCRT